MMPQKEKQHTVTVYFSQGAKFSTHFWPLSRKWKWRILTKHFDFVGWMFGSWLIRVLTLSPACHCSVGNESVVLEPMFDALKIHHSPQQFLHNAPNVLGYIHVNCDKYIELQSIRRKEYKGVFARVWITTFFAEIIKLFTYGYIAPHKGCVYVVKSVLKQGGVSIKNRIYTPKQLLHELQKMGFEYHTNNYMIETHNNKEPGQQQ